MDCVERHIVLGTQRHRHVAGDALRYERRTGRRIADADRPTHDLISKQPPGRSAASHHAIAFLASLKRQDIRRQFIDSVLPCLDRCPGDVRGHEQVRRCILDQRVAIARRLLWQHVDCGGRDPLCFSASTSAAESMSPPRAVLMRIAFGFMRRNSAAPKRPRVASFSGQCREITSAITQHFGEIRPAIVGRDQPLRAAAQSEHACRSASPSPPRRDPAHRSRRCPWSWPTSCRIG